MMVLILSRSLIYTNSHVTMILGILRVARLKLDAHHFPFLTTSFILQSLLTYRLDHVYDDTSRATLKLGYTLLSDYQRIALVHDI